jgi:hypothetical protein
MAGGLGKTVHFDENRVITKAPAAPPVEFLPRARAREAQVLRTAGYRVAPRPRRPTGMNQKKLRRSLRSF